MALTPLFTVQFQTRYPTTASLIQITDATDYAGEGIPLADAEVAGTITTPNGVPLAFTISPSVSLVTTVVMPLDANQAPMCGNYIISAVTTIDNGVDPPVAWPYGPITMQFCPAEITPVFDWSNSNCYAEPLVSVTNMTSYPGAMVSATFTLYPPSNAPYNTPIVSAGTTVTSGSVDVYSGQWSVRLTSLGLQTFSNYTWSYQVTHYASNSGVVVASSLHNISCGLLCAVNCCMNDAYDRWIAARTAGDKVNEGKYFLVYAQADAVYSQAQRAIECDNTSDVQGYIDLIKSILNCTSCGDCEASEGGLITPRYTGSGVTYTFFGAGSVTVSVMGTAVTYALSASAEAIIAGARNYALGLDSDLTAAGFTIVGPVLTPGTPPLNSATLSFTGTFPTVNQEYTEVFTIDWSLGPTALTRGTGVVSGTLFKKPVTLIAIDGAVLGWPSIPAQFQISDFYTAAAPGTINYELIMVAQNPDYRGTGSALGSGTHYIQVDGPNSANLAKATVRDSNTGAVVTWGQLQTIYRSISFALLLKRSV